MKNSLVLIRGAGEMATGTGHKLFRAGFGVACVEKENPRAVRRGVSWAQAVYSGEHTVEGVKALRVSSRDELLRVVNEGFVPVYPSSLSGKELPLLAIIDATLNKKNSGISREEALIVIALGPGFTAPDEVHAVIETCRGHHLGRVYYKGEALENTGVPGEIKGHTRERVLRSPSEGKFGTEMEIGSFVNKGDIIGKVGKTPVRAEISGVLRGLLYPGLKVEQGTKLGDIDPRGYRDYCFTISDKARNVAGGVLEALLYLRRKLYGNNQERE